jgi:hypothetical protein
MKKILTNICFLSAVMLSTNNLKAQAFPESFEGSFPPAGWVAFDNGIGTIASWTTSSTAQAGVQAAYVQYENVTTGIAEDWLVSPTVAITPSTSIFSFWERETYTTNWGSVYNILISTSSQTNTSTFTLVATYGENTVNPLVYKNRVINLSAYTGQTVYIAFRMDNDDGDDWLLDNIQLGGACTSPPSIGSITGTTSTSYGNTNQYTVTPVFGNLQWYMGSSPTGPWTAIPGATTTPQNITANTSGVMYLIAVASSTNPGCLDDTTNIAHAVNVFFPGDDVCSSYSLTVGGPGTIYYPLNGASVQSGEVMPPAGNCTTQVTWCNNTLNNTRWFTFTAPPSGHVIIHSPDFDTQLAVWKAATCGDLLSSSTATFVCANDDDPNYVTNGGVQYSSYLHAACLTPGTTYWLQVDAYSAAGPGDSTRIILTDGINPLDASFTGLNSVYCLPAAGSSLTPVSDGGIFTVNSNTTSVAGFSPSAAGVGTHTVYYSVSGCLSSSVTIVANTPTVMAASSSSLLCVGQSATLSATGAATYSWSSGGSGSSIVVSPSVTTSYTITGTNSSCSNTVALTQNVSACTSLNELANAAIKIWPNPNNGAFTVSTEVIPAEIIVTDILGKRLHSVKPNGNLTIIDIRSYDQGVYFVTIKTAKGSSVSKVIKE